MRNTDSGCGNTRGISHGQGQGQKQILTRFPAGEGTPLELRVLLLRRLLLVLLDRRALMRLSGLEEEEHEDAECKLESCWCADPRKRASAIATSSLNLSPMLCPSDFSASGNQKRGTSC